MGDTLKFSFDQFSTTQAFSIFRKRSDVVISECPLWVAGSTDRRNTF
jgi:hypothetical protein